MNDYTRITDLIAQCKTQEQIDTLLEKIKEIGGFHIIEKLLYVKNADNISTLLIYNQYIIDNNWNILNEKIKVIKVEKWSDIICNPFFVTNFYITKEYTYVFIPEKYLILKLNNTTNIISNTFPVHYLYQLSNTCKWLPIHNTSLYVKGNIHPTKLHNVVFNANLNPTKLYILAQKKVHLYTIHYYKET